MRRHNRELAVAIERPLSRHQFVKRHPHRVQVRTRIRRGDALNLLRRHVIQGADRRPCLSEFVIGRRAGDAEIHQLHHALRRQHHVGRLDIAVHHAACVRVIERRQHLHDVVHRLGGGQRSILEFLIQGDAFDELHQHEELIFHSHRRVQRGDVRMLQAGLHFDLAQKTVGQVGPK